MAITFRCRTCNNQIKAPDAAAGKKGKCPFCGHSNDIPAPPSEDDVIPLAEIDEEEERRAQQEIQALRQQEQDLLAETGGEPPVPLEHREEITSDDLHHFVVNYCLDMANGKLDRAETHVAQLRKYGSLAQDAVKDFAGGSASEPALGSIPQPVLQGFLKRLREQLSA